jgi:D-serine deaminase-like pyridoxal phosphate-dependent protein
MNSLKMELASLKTPSIVLDADKMRRNVAQMDERIERLGVKLRPHVKTHKSIEIARVQTAAHDGRIMVSTLAEARAFAAAGFTDITYGVPIEPGKFAEIFELAKNCERFAVITDDIETVRSLNAAAEKSGANVSVFLEIDTGDHRSGIAPDSENIIEIAREMSDAKNIEFAGLLTHAGHSYNAPSADARLAIARAERDLMVELKEKLVTDGIEVKEISIGSTPTITAIDDLTGIDEVRPGNYIFFDAFQATLGSCTFDDCALTVLAAVVHRSFDKKQVIIDAGAIALSKDRGAVDFDAGCGYGAVLNLEGNRLGLNVGGVSQEHGKIFVSDDMLLEKLTVGTRLRILANHSCLTAAQFDRYHVLENGRLTSTWPRANGW